MATTPPPPSSSAILSLYHLSVSLITLFIVLLAQDAITIPYVTPLVIFFRPYVAFIMYPITPFFGPLCTVGTIHVWRHPKCKPDTTTKVVMGAIVAQYGPTLSIAVRKAWESWNGELEFGEAWKGWVELTVLVGLGVSEGMSWKWEGGLLDGSVEKILKDYEGMVGGKERRLEESEEGKDPGVDVESKT